MAAAIRNLPPMTGVSSMTGGRDPLARTLGDWGRLISQQPARPRSWRRSRGLLALAHDRGLIAQRFPDTNPFPGSIRCFCHLSRCQRGFHDLPALAVLPTSTRPRGACTRSGRYRLARLRRIHVAADAAAVFEAKVFPERLSTPTDLAVLPDGRVIIIQKGAISPPCRRLAATRSKIIST